MASMNERDFGLFLGMSERKHLDSPMSIQPLLVKSDMGITYWTSPFVASQSGNHYWQNPHSLLDLTSQLNAVFEQLKETV